MVDTWAIPKYLGPMPTEMTTAQQLVDDRLDGSLHDFVASRRQRDPQASWRRIARDIYDATGVDLSDQTLSNWFPQYRGRFIDERVAS